MSATNNTTLFIPTATLIIIVSLSIMATNMISTVESRDDLTTIVRYLCSYQKVPLNDPYIVNVHNLLDDLQVRAAASLPDGYFEWNTDQGTTAYAYGDCDPSKDVIDCVYCLSECTVAFSDLCGTSVGAQITMKACYMRYESYRFM